MLAIRYVEVDMKEGWNEYYLQRRLGVMATTLLAETIRSDGNITTCKGNKE